MRIVIDMQGAQTESRFRGIGRYTMSFVQGVVRNKGTHEIFLVLNGLISNTVEPIRNAFKFLLPQDNIRIWYAPGPVCEKDLDNDARREAAELIREAFLASLQPDVIHITSLFEGYIDDAVTSVGRFDPNTPITVSLYDLIPLLNPEHYLDTIPQYRDYYNRKLTYLKNASRLLAISEFTRQEGLAHLEFEASHIINVSTAIEPCFRPIAIAEETERLLRSEFGIHLPFVLYTGGADKRKNLPRLIQAFASLPADLRKSHQLLFAGKMPEADQLQLKSIAQRAGLLEGELLFTGYISDEELVQLYNICALFVFPSWHEGFGLPALEGMACGAPVIGANTSSLPEVIGLHEALFDPLDVAAISQKMAKALEDDSFCDRLQEHGLMQAKKFSWDETAKRAIKAWETLPTNQLSAKDYLVRSTSYEQLINTLAANVESSDDGELIALAQSIAKNESAGTERQLLVDVSELCQHDAATGVQRVVRSYLKWLLQLPPVGFRVEPVYATRTEGYRYARRFTMNFKGEDMAQTSDDFVSWQRGDVFFGLDMQHHVQLGNAEFYKKLGQEGVVVKFLVHDLLPIELADLFQDSGAKELHEQWLSMIAATDEAICVSKATADAYDAWLKNELVYRAPGFTISWVHNGGDVEGSNPSVGLPKEAEVVFSALRKRVSFLCVSTIEPRKRQQQILDAVEELWKQSIDVNIVFVGNPGWKIEDLTNRLRSHLELNHRLFWLQGISDEYLEKVYAAATCLIAASLNEGFGLSLVEAARHGIPIIARDIPVFREVAGEHAFYFEGESAENLAASLISWLHKFHNKKHPLSIGMPWSTWQQSAEILKTLLVKHNRPRRQLLVDISELVQRDAKSGIQRVVRSLLHEWLTKPQFEYKIEPVYASPDSGYRYAKKFTNRFLNIESQTPSDELIEYAPGDVFLGLDLAPSVVSAQRHFYTKLKQDGVRVAFVVYDLLPLTVGNYPQEHSAACAEWLKVAITGDVAICISKSVASELHDWLCENKPDELARLSIRSFHLGADIKHSVPTGGLPESAESLLKLLRDKPTFLQVSTLAPHKGHDQVLKAFELLWDDGYDLNLVIVGKQGWLVEDLIDQLRNHRELNKHLFWLDGISDEYLEKIYQTATCLIVASHGEGFGLPLIEAAKHNLPIIARDIPVFNEVCEENAHYFAGSDPTALASSIRDWLKLCQNGKQPLSQNMKWLKWADSAACLLRCCTD